MWADVLGNLSKMFCELWRYGEPSDSADIVSKRWGMFSFCVIGKMPFTALTGEIETTLILLWR